MGADHTPQAATVPFALVFMVVMLPGEAVAPWGREEQHVSACMCAHPLFSIMGTLLCLGSRAALTKQAAYTDCKQAPAKQAQAAVQHFQSLASQGPATRHWMCPMMPCPLPQLLP